MRHRVLICLLAYLLAGCGENNSIAGKYSGGSTTNILGGNMPTRGSVSMRATVKQQDNKIAVRFQSCSVDFEIYDTGLANVIKNSSCTIDPEVDGGTTFLINQGQANFGDDSFGMTLHGVASDNATWDFTFAGVRQ